MTRNPPGRTANRMMAQSMRISSKSVPQVLADTLGEAQAVGKQMATATVHPGDRLAPKGKTQ